MDIEAAKLAAKRQGQGYLTLAEIPGGFDEPRQLLGEENLCISYYEQPELLHDILNTISQTSLKVFERILEHVTIDCLCVHEDMAGKSGPLAGPSQIQSFIKPYYQAVWQELSRHGCKLFSQDSDGNMNSVLDSFLDCGITTTFPCEPAAGMDIVQIRKKYGNRLSLKGGIDKFCLLGGKEAVRRELEYKISETTKGGGTVFAIDHRIPNGVPLDIYKYYVELGRQMLGLSPISGKGFEKMAF